MLGTILDVVFLAMLILAVAVVEERNLVSAVVKYSLLSLLFILALFELNAPDVALSAIVVGAIVIGVFLFTIKGVTR
ncbi:multisubunit sodium/hydrogen antiporter, MnhG subunit [Thermococcus sp. 4557]|uniref:hydrogenase subunit MbhD domain-containing protein n=1 Tax=Thermococcus sp. (strain CGMCC 1.5172 / 4557) TaxID=1042877 RepID=UPI000219EF8E|nr:hydrogenase subunit MbhD domain-containing protein [Thermococcus sp. 4557]AEK73730.1 multisubunit sodium/hydrogen antiporter, MnhG subunit [Thermococcus sp. 4557]